jgi:hypothetical protein
MWPRRHIGAHNMAYKLSSTVVRNVNLLSSFGGWEWRPVTYMALYLKPCQRDNKQTFIKHCAAVKTDNTHTTAKKGLVETFNTGLNPPSCNSTRLTNIHKPSSTRLFISFKLDQNHIYIRLLLKSLSENIKEECTASNTGTHIYLLVL